MRGSSRSRKTASGFGRNDRFLGWRGESNYNRNGQQQISYGDDNKKNKSRQKQADLLFDGQKEVCYIGRLVFYIATRANLRS